MISRLKKKALNVWYTFSSDGDELDALAGDKIQCLVDIGNLVESHLSPVGLGQGLAGDDFQQEHELESVAEIILDVVNSSSGFAQVRIAPGCKSLPRKTNKFVKFHMTCRSRFSAYLADNLSQSNYAHTTYSH